jgi:protein SCO1
MIRRRTRSMLAAAALAAAAVPARAEECCHHESDTPRERERPSAEAGARRTARYALPPVTLVDQAGRPASIAQLLPPGETVIVNFVFTTCTTICPVMTATLARVQRQLCAADGPVRMVSISIDPETDRPDRLAAYARRFHAGAGWSFWTGTADDVRAVLAAFDVLSRDRMSHRPVTLVRRAGAAEWIRLEGLVSAETLAAQVRALRAER